MILQKPIERDDLVQRYVIFDRCLHAPQGYAGEEPRC
jgi:hypothetical protein